MFIVFENNVFILNAVTFLLGIHSGQRCKSGFPVFAWRVTWNYADIPFKLPEVDSVWNDNF